MSTSLGEQLFKKIEAKTAITDQVARFMIGGKAAVLMRDMIGVAFFPPPNYDNIQGDDEDDIESKRRDAINNNATYISRKFRNWDPTYDDAKYNKIHRQTFDSPSIGRAGNSRSINLIVDTQLVPFIRRLAEYDRGNNTLKGFVRFLDRFNPPAAPVRAAMGGSAITNTNANSNSNDDSGGNVSSSDEDAPLLSRARNGQPSAPASLADDDRKIVELIDGNVDDSQLVLAMRDLTIKLNESKPVTMTRDIRFRSDGTMSAHDVIRIMYNHTDNGGSARHVWCRLLNNNEDLRVMFKWHQWPGESNEIPFGGFKAMIYMVMYIPGK